MTNFLKHVKIAKERGLLYKTKSMNDKPIIKIQKNLSENKVPPGYANERLSLMTDYYGAFSTSTSNFPGQIQSATIDTSL